MYKELIIIIVSILISFISLLLGPPGWGLLGVKDQQLLNNLSATTALLVLFVGFLLAIYSIIEKGKNDVSTLIPKELRRSILNLHVAEFHPGIDGLTIITRKIGNIKKVLNTRLIPPDYKGQLYRGDATIWNQSIPDGVKNGIEFVDIVSGQGVDAARKIKGDLEKLGHTVRGIYTAIQIDFDWKSFMNFKILFFKDGTKEVWVGWRVSNITTIDEPCFRSADDGIIKLFENWHSDLMNSGEKIVVFPEKSLY